MSNPIFSVVIPAYNSSKFITPTLDSIEAQTFKDFEVIIVNDGSTDNTPAVILEYIAFHPNLNIRFFSQENKGIAGARNRGIREANGYYIAFLDHDDIWYSEKLSKCYKIFKAYPDIDLICHDEVIKDVTGKFIRYLFYRPNTDKMFRRLLFKGNCLSPSATLVKKNILLEAGLFRENLELLTVEDYDLWIRLSKKYKFYFLKEVLGEYIMNRRSASLNLERHYNNQIQVLKLNFKEYDKKKLWDYSLINFRIIKLYLLIVKDAIKTKKIKKALYYFFKIFLQIFDKSLLRNK